MSLPVLKLWKTLKIIQTVLVLNHPSLIKCLLENENWSTQCGHNTPVNITKVTHALKIIQYEKYKLVNFYLVQTPWENARIFDVRQSCSESGSELSIFIWDLIFHTWRIYVWCQIFDVFMLLFSVISHLVCKVLDGSHTSTEEIIWFTKKFVNSSKHVLVCLAELN